MRRHMCLLMVLILTLSSVVFSAAAEETTPSPTIHTCGNFEYVILEDGTAKITGFVSSHSYNKTIDIPKELNGIPVTVIGDSALSGHKDKNRITIPNGVTTIEAHAFSNCKELELIDIPKSVTSIGDFAFSGCSKMKVFSFGKNRFDHLSDPNWRKK